MLDELWAAEHLPAQAAAEFQPGNLEAKFVAPPFSVLDTRQGYWQERRRAWLSMGMQSELGRGATVEADDGALAGPVRASIRRRQAMEHQNEPGYRQQAAMRSGDGRTLVPGKGNARSDFGAYQPGDARAFSHDLMKGEDDQAAGISIFDPVLCELAYRWWAPEGGTILDPFAGGSVRGLVAAKLGHPYTGIDLSGPQVAANRQQAATILLPGEPVPTWHNYDSRTLDTMLPAGELYDLIFSCPPYFDLEVYSDDPTDLSAMDWHGFLEAYEDIIGKACARLRPGRFAVFVVSEIRGPEGAYRGLVPRTISAFQRVGMAFYNEAVLVNSAGSAPLRATKQFEASRKLVRLHQNVLCFLKGDAPRGWAYERPAPPSPQLDLALAVDPAPATPPLAAAVPEAPAPAPVGPEPDTEAPGPFIAGNPDAVPEPDVMGAAVWEAAVAAEAHQAEALRQLDDGRWADPATGELFRDEGGAPGDPVPPLVAPAPAPLPERAMLTNPGNEWRCAGCGSAPSGPLASTVMEGMARGDCDNCGTEKVYRRLQ